MTDPSGHLDDALSAYLDDELTPSERIEVDQHLAGCADCRADLDAEAEVRRLVRELPAVDPPFGFYERIRRDGPGAGQAPGKKRRLRFGLVNIAGAAAAWLLILGVVNVNTATGSVEPATADFVQAHASVEPELGTAESPEQAAKAQADYGAPVRLAGTYQLVGYVDGGDAPQLLYSDGRRIVSMFLRPGRLNQDALPSDAEPVHVNGVLAWQVPTSAGAVVFLQRPGVVVILVGVDPDQAASDMAGPNGLRADEHESMLDHLTDAGEGLLETFGFQG